MPIHRLEPHNNTVTWAASGNINLELAPKPYTITAMFVGVRTSVTTTSTTDYNDYWDRVISRLNLTGKGKTFFDFTNMRVAYHQSRGQLGPYAPPRPTVIAGSQTTLVQHFGYLFHFGTRPFRIGANGGVEYNPWDLTAGIPPVESGNLTLGGTFGAATAMGANVTVASGSLEVYLFGVQRGPGELPNAHLPQAVPVWSMRTPTPGATSGGFATQDNVPAGDFLHDMMIMTTNGTGSPRDDSVLNSLEFFNTVENRSIVKFGQPGGAVGDYKAAEIISQCMLGRQAWAPSDNVSTAMTGVLSGGTAGVPVVTAGSDAGLVYLPVWKFATRGHPLYGADMRGVNTGDLQLRYGVSDATGVTMDVFYRKYQPFAG